MRYAVPTYSYNEEHKEESLLLVISRIALDYSKSDTIKSMNLTFYPAFLGILISIVSLTYLARREYQSGQTHTISQLGAGHQKALRQFRAILWVCGTLFTITMLFYIAPRLHSPLMFVVWSLTYACEVLLGVIPDHKGWQRIWHNIFAWSMAAGFFVTATFFSLRLSGVYQIISVFILAGMLVSAALIYFDHKRNLVYELSSIFLSHIGILVAALYVAEYL